jgi:hypothetical protein
MKYSSYLKYLDLYGIPYNFTLFNESLYKSTIGGIMTIITLISFVLSFLYFSKDFYLRQNPNFILQQEIKPSFDSFNISEDSIFFSINLYDIYDNIIDYPQYFEITAINSKYNNIDKIVLVKF